MRWTETRARTTGNEDIHTQAKPYCRKLTCWCHTSVAYHHTVTHQQASESEIAHVYHFLGLAGTVRRHRHARSTRDRVHMHMPLFPDDAPGEVYLIHLNQPFRHARHYLGWTLNLERRLAQHRAGTGAKLLRAVNRHGISWEVVRVWPGGPELEQTLKALKNSPRLCPVCVQAALLQQLNIQPLQEPAEALW